MSKTADILDPLARQALQDLQARQGADEDMRCPRCGVNPLKHPMARNTLSRHARLFICGECGHSEALMESMATPFPLSEWAAFRQVAEGADFYRLGMDEVKQRVLTQQLDTIQELYHEWRQRAPGAHFQTIRTRAVAALPGLVSITETPFCCIYAAADGNVVVQLRPRGGRVDISVCTVSFVCGDAPK